MAIVTRRWRDEEYGHDDEEDNDGDNDLTGRRR